MRKTILTFSIILLGSNLLLAQVTGAPATQPVMAAPTGWVAFGQALKLDPAQTVSVDAVLKDPQAFHGKEVRLAGLINKVCVPKGCWMQFDSPGSEMPVFVKFTCPIDGRLIPLDAVGKEAVVEGKLEITEISEAAARHYLEDEGAKPEEIAKIVGPQKQLKLSGPGALVKQ